MLISILIVGLSISCYYLYNTYKRALKAEEELLENVKVFNKADSIVSRELNKNLELVVTSKPQEFDLGKADILTYEVKKLIDSVNHIIAPPKKSKVVKYSKTEFEASVEGVAEVIDSVAYLNKDNWDLSYSYRDNLFKGNFKGEINDYTYYVPKTFLGIEYEGKGEMLSSKWFTGNSGVVVGSTTVFNNTKKVNKIKIDSKTSYRFLDNTVLTGADIFYGTGRLKVGGNLSYNVTSKKPETELSIKFGIVK